MKTCSPQGFNPLEIGSSVRSAGDVDGIRVEKSMFQSPRNRVKCSESALAVTAWTRFSEFQSPRNRVKCSEKEKKMFTWSDQMGFQSPRNRVKCSEKIKPIDLQVLSI